MRGRVLKKDLTFSVLSTLLCKRYVDLLFFYFFSGPSLVNISLLIFVPGFSHLFFFLIWRVWKWSAFSCKFSKALGHI